MNTKPDLEKKVGEVVAHARRQIEYLREDRAREAANAAQYLADGDWSRLAATAAKLEGVSSQIKTLQFYTENL